MPMKKFMMLSILSLLFVMTYAQTTTVQKPSPEQYLTTEQLIKYQSDLKIAELEKKLQTYGNWVGVGGEIGQAVKEGLGAIVDVSDKFGKTDVGKFTMVMIAWKVMGKDVTRIALGLLFITIMVIMLFIIHNRAFKPHRILIENPGLFKYPKKYEIVNKTEDWDGYNFVKTALFPIIFMITIGITYAIMFS